jgi:hypothetical protein
MKCKKCWKEYNNPYVNTWYCSKYCEDNDEIRKNWDEFVKNFFWGFMKK